MNQRRKIKLQYTIFIKPEQVKEIIQKALEDQGYIVQADNIDFRVEIKKEDRSNHKYPEFMGAHVTLV